MVYTFEHLDGNGLTQAALLQLRRHGHAAVDHGEAALPEPRAQLKVHVVLQHQVAGQRQCYNIMLFSFFV